MVTTMMMINILKPTVTVEQCLHPFCIIILTITIRFVANFACTIYDVDAIDDDDDDDGGDDGGGDGDDDGDGDWADDLIMNHLCQ